MTVLEALSIIAPQFDSLPLQTREYYIEVAEQQTSQCEFDTDYIFASANLAAHMLTLIGRNGIGGEVQSLKEGDLQVTYATLYMATDPMLNTSYGQEYERLRRLHLVLFRVAFNPVSCQQ